MNVKDCWVPGNAPKDFVYLHLNMPHNGMLSYLSFIKFNRTALQFLHMICQYSRDSCTCTYVFLYVAKDIL